MKSMMIVFSVLFMSFGLAHSFTVKDIGFPYKGFIYKSLGITPYDYNKITVSKNGRYHYDFTYNGVSYKAKLYYFGMIHVQGGGKNFLINFDVSKYRENTFIKMR